MNEAEYDIAPFQHTESQTEHELVELKYPRLWVHTESLQKLAKQFGRNIHIFQNTFQHFRMQDLGRMYRYGCALADSVFVDLMTAVLSRERKPALLQHRYNFPRGNSGKFGHAVLCNRHLNRRKRHRARLSHIFVLCPSILNMEPYGARNVLKRLFIGVALAVAALQVGTHGKIAVAVALNHHGKSVHSFDFLHAHTIPYRATARVSWPMVL